MASAAALATIETIVEEGLVENSRTVGDFLLRGLRGLQEKYEFLGHVRGLGLMIGVELVKDRKTKEPLDRDVTRQLFLELLKRGMISMSYKASFRINPPLIFTKKEAETALQILDDGFSFVANHISYKG